MIEQKRNFKLTAEQARQKWVEALKSGEYSQTTEKLYDSFNNGYCCLGVACEIYQKLEDKDLGARGEWNHDEELPFEVQEWLDLSNSCGQLIGQTGKTNLISLNDKEMFSFEQIAEVIKEGWVEYGFPIQTEDVD